MPKGYADYIRSSHIPIIPGFGPNLNHIGCLKRVVQRGSTVGFWVLGSKVSALWVSGLGSRIEGFGFRV